MSFANINIKPYVVAGLLLALAWVNGHFFGMEILESASKGHEGSSALTAIAIAAACIAVMFGKKFSDDSKVSVYAMYLAFGTAVGSFLAPLEGSIADTLKLLAVLVLALAGVKLKVREFGKVAIQVLILSTFGVLGTAWLFAEFLVFAGPFLGSVIPATGANLTGSAIASTDPAAIVPVVGALLWVSKQAEKALYLANAEAAGTDGGGTVIYSAILALAAGGMMVDVRTTGFGSLFTTESAAFLGAQIGGAAVAGVVGAVFLWGFQKYRGKNPKGAALQDVLAFVASTFIAYAVADALDGNVYIAGFLAGLFFNVEQQIEHAVHAYDENIEEYAIPFIFVLGGVPVDVIELIKYAPIGIVSSFVLIWGIRPLVVNACLRPFTFIKVGGEPMCTKEQIKFLSSVRQLGAIAIVLAADIASKNIPGTEAVVPITVWNAFITLWYCTPKVKSVAIELGLAREKEPLETEQVEA